MWLKAFKIAIIEKDTQKLSKLIDELPELKTKEEMTEALYLLKEATQIVTTLKDEASHSMQQLKKNINFLESTQRPHENRLDLKF